MPMVNVVAVAAEEFVIMPPVVVVSPNSEPMLSVA